MWKRGVVLALLLTVPVVSGNAAAISGLQNDEVPNSISDLFDITRHGVPVMGYLISGILFVILGIVVAARGGLTKTGAMIVAIGLTLFWYGLLPDITAMILGFAYTGIIAQTFLRTLAPWISV